MANSKIIIQIEDRLRPCMVRKTRGLFHKWVSNSANGKQITVGLVEYADGTVHEAYPNEIVFIDGWVDVFHDNL